VVSVYFRKINIVNLEYLQWILFRNKTSVSPIPMKGFLSSAW